jgi:hypothetical protein
MLQFGPVVPINPAEQEIEAIIRHKFHQMTTEQRVAHDLRNMAELLEAGAFIVTRYWHRNAYEDHNHPSAHIILDYAARPIDTKVNTVNDVNPDPC